MSSSQEQIYRNYAAAMLDLASRAASNDGKRRLLFISEAWLNLADKVARSAGQRKSTQRLVREVLFEDSETQNK